MNIGIVGGGMVARAHIRALQEIKDAPSIFLYTRDPSRSESLANEFTGVDAVSSLEGLVDKVAGIIIATPNNTHLSILKNITFVKSIPVLCEKPLASSYEDAKTFLELAHPLSIIGFNYRFNQAVLSILTLVKTGALGNFYIDLAMNRDSALTKKVLSWRDNASQNGSSGAFGDLGSHLLDLVNYISGSQIEMQCFQVSKGMRVTTRAGASLTEDDHCVVAGKTVNNIFFKIQTSKSARISDLGLSIHIILTQGEIFYSSQSSNKIIFTPSNSIEEQELALRPPRIEDPKSEVAYWADSFFLQNELWLKQIKVGKLLEPLANIEAGVKIQALLTSASKM